MVFPHTWVGTFMLYTRGLYDSIHLNLYPIINGGGGLCHVKFDQCYWFLFVRNKKQNNNIMIQDWRLWWYLKSNQTWGNIYSQRSVLNLNIDLFLLETNCLVDQEKIQSIDRTYSVQQKTTGNQCFKTLNSKQANRINV